MKKNEKVKKTKKSAGRKQKTAENIITSDDELDPNVQESLELTEPEEKKVKCLDILQRNIVEISSGKGHNTYFSKSTINVGLFYFEVLIKQNTQTILEYLISNKKCEENKKHDEFVKKYYSNVNENPKIFSPTVRIGLCNQDGDFELPLGCNELSYSYRSSDGYLINNGDYFVGNPVYGVNDVVGVLIHLKQPMPDFLKLKENLEKNSKGIVKNPQSYLKFYLNGELLQNSHFSGLWEGSYHVGATLYNFANVSMRFAKKDLKYFQRIESEYKNVKLIVE